MTLLLRACARARLRAAAAMLAVALVAQAPAAAADSDPNATLVPQTVYVGDRARLIVVLDSPLAVQERGSLVIDAPGSLPRSDDLVVHRMELDRKTDSAQVYIDFVAFVPGELTLPVVEIGPVSLTGLRVRIASVLEDEEGGLDLSPPESPMAAPGTAPLLYGGIAALALLAAAGLLFAFRGLPFVKAIFERYRRSRIARSMRRTIARLSAALDSVDPGEFFSALCAALREYLSDRTGVDCRALTGKEYRSVFIPGNAPLSFDDLAFLESVFRRGDEVRFGRLSPADGELRASIDGVSSLVDRLEADLQKERVPAGGRPC